MKGYRRTSITSLGCVLDRKLYVQGSSINRIAWSPDGKILALACTDGTVRLWNMAKIETDTVVKEISAITTLEWSPDGKTLAYGSMDKIVRFWDVTSGKR